jgi:23S rRNA (guanosine2251-2'-O)-methyltransferase
LYVDPTRRDARMKQFLSRAAEAGVRVIEADGPRLTAPGRRRRPPGRGGARAGARAGPLARRPAGRIGRAAAAAGAGRRDRPAQPGRLPARGRRRFGAHAVIAPKDHAAGINATVAKVASGAAESVPYLMVTNLARTLGS